MDMRATNRLDRPVDETRDHVLGPADAPVTVVEYGSYACPYCRAANQHIAEVRDRMGSRMRYVFRHRPLTGNDLARRAAELAERAETPAGFWRAHVRLMTRSGDLTEEDLSAIADELGLAEQDPEQAEAAARRAEARVAEDEASARASGVMVTPTFFINGRRYDGAWDASSLSDAIEGRLGPRLKAVAIDFASWGPSAGLLLLLATVLAVAVVNSPLGPAFTALWHLHLRVALGDLGYGLALLDWVNDGLLTIFFLVVGLEIKREFTVGRLAARRSAAFPVAAAIGGMAAPALLYMAAIPAGTWTMGWGVPMATDTAFAVALIVMLGRRVPVELRVFITAAAIVDDIGAIAVVAVFYSGALDPWWLAGAVAATAGLWLLNRWAVTLVTPYVLVGVVLWACVHEGGLHATLAGVVLAMFIPTRPPANLRALATQANAIIAAEAAQGGEVLRRGPSLPALRALDAIHDRLESPADRLLRHAGARSSYVVLPIFALANAGVEITAGMAEGHWPLMLAIGLGLAVGKPLGMLAACLAAVRFGLAVKPAEYGWLQLAGAGALAGIGFTMSLFIAGQAFPVHEDFAAAKIAVFGASVLSALVGVVVLWRAGRPGEAGRGRHHLSADTDPVRLTSPPAAPVPR